MEGDADGRIDHMSKYTFSKKAASNWRAAGALKLSGHREKREAMKADLEKLKAQLKEAVELHERVRAESAASVKALIDADGGLANSPDWLVDFQSSKV